jgi:putative glutamine amidotransferase
VKPRIGITTSPTVHEDRFLEALDRAYVTAVIRAGAVPLVLPVFSGATGELEDVVTCLDGLLLSGGGDIDPARYGGTSRPEVKGVDAERDTFELELARAAVRAGLPMLGICRGSQLLNVAMGGTLVEDLADVTELPHCQRERWAETVHEVQTLEGSRLQTVVGAGVLGVNSLHHQAVDVVGTGLRACAWADDGVIEAVEGVGPLRLLGVQWHPELLPTEAGHPALFDWLADEAARRRPSAVTTRVAFDGDRSPLAPAPVPMPSAGAPVAAAEAA